MGPPTKVPEATTDVQNGKIRRSDEKLRDAEKPDLWLKRKISKLSDIPSLAEFLSAPILLVGQTEKREKHMDPLLAEIFASPDEAQAVFDDPEHPDWELAYAYLCEHPETADVMRALVERTHLDVVSENIPYSTGFGADADLSDLEKQIDDALQDLHENDPIH